MMSLEWARDTVQHGVRIPHDLLALMILGLSTLREWRYGWVGWEGRLREFIMRNPLAFFFSRRHTDSYFKVERLNRRRTRERRLVLDGRDANDGVN